MVFRGKRGAADDGNDVDGALDSPSIGATGLVSTAFLPERHRPSACEKPGL